MRRGLPVERLRELLGVPPGNYERVDNLMRKVIDPAVLQVNGLSDMSVAIEPRRRHSRAPVHEFALTWWKKHGDEFRAAMQERNRSKVGRMARLRGQVEKAEAVAGVWLGLTEAERAAVDAELAEKYSGACGPRSGRRQLRAKAYYLTCPYVYML